MPTTILLAAFWGQARLAEFFRLNWPLLVPVALGFVGIYLLLPKARQFAPILGGVLAGLALVLLGWLAIDHEAAWPEQVLFYAFAGIAIVGGALLITHKNPVYAALSFALVVLSTCGLFLLQAAPFLMAATIIIYAGAIVVTFLFVIMLAQQAGIADADRRSREPFLASLAGFVLLGALACVLHKNYDTRELDALLSQVRQLADSKSADDVIAILGDPARRSPDELAHPLVSSLSKFFPGEDAVLNLELDWQAVKKPEHLMSLQLNSRRILALGPERRVAQGVLRPAPQLPLSRFAGEPANVSVVPTKDGKLPERLPARNVRGLGLALFTDYLLPVELAAMLLLVATIGAIVIASRRSEVLR
jgi:NADH:ubiquinone oxidoreductase subunit 6 (subunit J)